MEEDDDDDDDDSDVPEIESERLLCAEASVLSCLYPLFELMLLSVPLSFANSHTFSSSLLYTCTFHGDWTFFSPIDMLSTFLLPFSTPFHTSRLRLYSIGHCRRRQGMCMPCNVFIYLYVFYLPLRSFLKR